jgi:hypothetical protein
MKSKLSISNTTTINMNGNSTGYGAASGNEVFNLSGYENNVLLAGANDTINVISGLDDSVDLNSTGFAGAVTDNLNLGASSFDHITTSHALQGASVAITAAGGPNTISMTNHGGATSISLGYVGDPALQGPTLANLVTLNGDATNSVMLSAGDGVVRIGAASDGNTSFTSSVSFTGVDDTLAGGDEAFTVSNTTATLNTISLGNGHDSVTLAGTGNTISLGNGNDFLALSGGQNTAALGGGTDTVSLTGGLSRLAFAIGDAGVKDSVTMATGAAFIRGGDENFSINSTQRATVLSATLGNGNNTIAMAFGNAHLLIGDSLANTANNTVILSHGGANATFNGGVDTISLKGSTAVGADTITLNASMLGTQLTTSGVFDTVTLTHDANATINDTGVNAGLSLTLDADATGGFGTIAITGLASDDLAQIHLAGASTYSITTDVTAVGGITLHFAHGSIDLVGLQAVPNNLFGG